MIPDRYTKIVLTVIAIALSIIALNPWIAPTPVKAQDSRHGLIPDIESMVSAIEHDVHGIYSGTCTNDKVC